MLVWLLAVTGVDLIDHAHAVDHASKGREALSVELDVVVGVDEQLGGTGIRSGSSESDGATHVVLRYRIVFQVGLTPPPRDVGVAVEAELNNEVGDHAKKAVTIEIAGLDKRVETVRADRSPVAFNLDEDRALSGVETDFEVVGGLLVGDGRKLLGRPAASGACPAEQRQCEG